MFCIVPAKMRDSCAAQVIWLFQEMFDPVRSFAVGNIIAPTARQHFCFFCLLIISSYWTNALEIIASLILLNFKSFILSVDRRRRAQHQIHSENIRKLLAAGHVTVHDEEKFVKNLGSPLWSSRGRWVFIPNERTNETICSCTVCVCVCSGARLENRKIKIYRHTHKQLNIRIYNQNGCSVLYRLQLSKSIKI